MYLFIALLAEITLSFSVNAQNTDPTYRHQVQVGYGLNIFNRNYTTRHAEDIKIKLPNDNLLFRPIRNDIQTNVSSINLYYHFKTKKNVSIGVSFITDFYKRTYQTLHNDLVYSVKDLAQVYTLMPNFYYHYLNRKTVRMYFGAEIGMMYFTRRIEEVNYRFDSNETSKILPTFNITPIGIRLKYKLSPYFQVNIGSRGWVEGGLSYQFGK